MWTLVICPEASAKADQDLVTFTVMQGPFLAAGGFTKPLGDEAIKDGSADLVVFGRWWLSTPDLPERFAQGAPLNHYDRCTPQHGSSPINNVRIVLFA